MIWQDLLSQHKAAGAAVDWQAVQCFSHQKGKRVSECVCVCASVQVYGGGKARGVDHKRRPHGDGYYYQQQASIRSPVLEPVPAQGRQ